MIPIILICLFALVILQVNATPPACFMSCISDLSRGCDRRHIDFRCLCENREAVIGCLVDICPYGNFDSARDHFMGTCVEQLPELFPLPSPPPSTPAPDYPEYPERPRGPKDDGGDYDDDYDEDYDDDYDYDNDDEEEDDYDDDFDYGDDDEEEDCDDEWDDVEEIDDNGNHDVIKKPKPKPIPTRRNPNSPNGPRRNRGNRSSTTRRGSARGRRPSVQPSRGTGRTSRNRSPSSPKVSAPTPNKGPIRDQSPINIKPINTPRTDSPSKPGFPMSPTPRNGQPSRSKGRTNRRPRNRSTRRKTRGRSKRPAYNRNRANAFALDLDPLLVSKLSDIQSLPHPEVQASIIENLQSTSQQSSPMPSVPAENPILDPYEYQTNREGDKNLSSKNTYELTQDSNSEPFHRNVPPGVPPLSTPKGTDTFQRDYNEEEEEYDSYTESEHENVKVDSRIVSRQSDRAPNRRRPESAEEPKDLFSKQNIEADAELNRLRNVGKKFAGQAHNNININNNNENYDGSSRFKPKKLSDHLPEVASRSRSRIANYK